MEGRDCTYELPLVTDRDFSVLASANAVVFVSLFILPADRYPKQTTESLP
jgi:hypothetical protein